MSGPTAICTVRISTQTHSSVQIVLPKSSTKSYKLCLQDVNFRDIGGTNGFFLPLSSMPRRRNRVESGALLWLHSTTGKTLSSDLKVVRTWITLENTHKKIILNKWWKYRRGWINLSALFLRWKFYVVQKRSSRVTTHSWLICWIFQWCVAFIKTFLHALQLDMILKDGQVRVIHKYCPTS